MNSSLMKRCISLAAIAALLTISACSPSTKSPDSADSQSPGQTNQTASSESTAQFPRTVKHFMGSTEIPSAPQRIVALDSSYLDAVLLLGGNLVGYTNYRALDDAFPDYLGDVSAQTTDAQDVGSLAEPSLEKILAQKPDLIVSAKVRQGDMYPELAKIAPTVFSETTGPTWKENIELVGEAMGKEKEAKQFLQDYKDKAARVGAAIMKKQPDLTYSLVRFGSQDVRLYTSNSFIGEIMSDMGIPRPKDAPDDPNSILVPMSPETILDMDAKLIMVSIYDGDEAQNPEIKARAEEYQNNPLWKRLTGDIVFVDDRTYVSSVSLQGANAVIDQLAERFGVES